MDLESFSIFGRSKIDGSWTLLHFFETKYGVPGEPERKKFLFWEYTHTPKYTVFPDKEKVIGLAWDRFLSKDYQDISLVKRIGEDFGYGYETYDIEIWLNGRWVDPNWKRQPELMIF
jgi:hypothetical protein